MKEAQKKKEEEAKKKKMGKGWKEEDEIKEDTLAERAILNSKMAYLGHFGKIWLNLEQPSGYMLVT